MLRQVIKIASLGSLVVGLCVFAFLMSKIPSKAYFALWYYAKAWLFSGFHREIEVSHEFLKQFSQIQHHSNQTLPVNHILRLTEPIAQSIALEAYSSLIKSLMAFGISMIAILSFFFYRGRLSKSKQHLSGSKLVSSRWLGLKQRLKGTASPIKLEHLNLTKGTETQHILITGGTGSGKTNCLHHLLSQIRLKKQKAIIVDTSGVFLDRYFRNGTDFLLNPFDERSVNWSP